MDALDPRNTERDEAVEPHDSTGAAALWAAIRADLRARDERA